MIKAVILLTVMCGVASGQASQPATRPSKALTAAESKRDKALADAASAWRAARGVAIRSFADDLQAAEEAALDAHDLAQANLIDSELKEARDALAQDTAPLPATRPAEPAPAARATPASPARTHQRSLVPRITPGRWRVSYSNNADRLYEVDSTGNVFFPAERKQAQIRPDAVWVLIDFHDGIIERVTVLGDRIFVEHYNPASTYPDGRPAHLGVGVRVQ